MNQIENLLAHHKGRIAELEMEVQRLKANMRKLYKENRHMKKLAEAWMHDYDKLKAKYEPLDALIGGG